MAYGLLSPAGVDPALLLGLALLTGQRAVGSFAAVALIALACVMLLRRRFARGVWAAAVVLFLVGLGRSWLALRSFERTYEHTLATFGPPARCEGEVVVTESPVGKSDVIRWHGRATSLFCEGRTLTGEIEMQLYGDNDEIARGDRWFVVADLASVPRWANPDVADSWPFLARQRVVVSGGVLSAQRQQRSRSLGACIDRGRRWARRRIVATYPAAAAHLARALVLGETGLNAEDDEAFRKSGLAHLLAVSGTHVILVVLTLVRVLRALLLRWHALASRGEVGRYAAAVGAAIALLYADFAGGSGSAWRAAWMMAIALGAQSVGVRMTGVRAFALSLVVLGACDPLVAYDLSFVLSVTATAGLLWWSRPLLHLLSARLPAGVRPLVVTLSATLAATLACAPVVLSMGMGLPVVGLITNSIAVPLGELAALPLCLGHLVVAPVAWLERGAARTGAGALLLLQTVARVSARPAWASLPLPPPTSLQIALLLLTLVVALTVSGRSRWLVSAVGGAAWLLAEGLAVRAGCPRGTLRVTALDVGQGDSLLIDFPNGALLVLDGGGMVGSPVDPGQRVVAPVLRARRRSHIDVAVLSHPHPDHFLGLASALPMFSVGEFWDTGQGDQQDAGSTYRQLRAGLASRQVPTRFPKDLCDRPHRFGDATVRVLEPCPAFRPAESANDNSLVLQLSYGKHVALLMGDAERAAEERLLERYGDSLHADLLKLGHHGSKTSTTRAFLQRVRPSCAILSCGVRNRFGHPHPTTLATLTEAGIFPLRTDRGGAIIWQTDGNEIQTQRP